jgi:hypothetical protein
MEAVTLEALLGALADAPHVNDLKKRMESLSKGPKALDTPAARAVEERALRKVQCPPAPRLGWGPLPAPSPLPTSVPPCANAHACACIWKRGVLETPLHPVPARAPCVLSGMCCLAPCPLPHPHPLSRRAHAPYSPPVAHAHARRRNMRTPPRP